MNVFNNLGLTQGATIQLELAPPVDGSPRQKVAVRPRSSSSSSSSGINNVEPELLPLYSNGDPIAGEIRVTPPPGKRLEHAGIKVRLIGRVELPSDRGGKHEFVSLVRDLSPPGELGAPATYRFDFGRVELPYESYSGGGAARLTYSVRASVKRPYGGSTAKEWGLAVRNARDEAPAGSEAGIGEKNPISSPTSTSSTSTPSTSTPPIKMEVGIEDCLHIEFEYEKASYHLSDVVLGRISFLLVRIRLKHMELEIRRRETSGSGSSARSEATTLAKYEIMDGAPVRGETVPIRLCLAPYDLTPTYLNVHNKFSARYFLNLVLVDEEDRRYFKQQEITLWRKRGADERACRGGEGCGGAPAPLQGGVTGSDSPPPPPPPGAAAAAVPPPPATPSAGVSAEPAAAAVTTTAATTQQPTEQLQREEEAKEDKAVAAAKEQGKRGEDEANEAAATAASAATTEGQQPPPATPS